MTKTQALALYNNNGAALARALRISKQAVSAWNDGPIPLVHVLKLRYVIRPGRAKSPARKRRHATPAEQAAS